MKRIPYAAQWIGQADLDEVDAALRSDYLTQGPRVELFEKKVADYCGAKYAVAVNSGTSALHIACLSADIEAEDEVITSPITFVASSNAVLYCGGRPVFADVEPGTINIDPREIKKKLSRRTKAIIPVHFAGNPCDLSAIQKIARKKDITVIEDASHALGAVYKGSRIGSCKYSDMTVLSFHAVKIITTGEGGMVLTNDPGLRDALLHFRSHGITRDPSVVNRPNEPWYYEMHKLGYNYRLTDIQSALGSSQLKKIGKFVKRRNEIAAAYTKAFSKHENISVLSVRKGLASAWHIYMIKVPERRRVFNALREKGILVNVHYIPVYKQPYYQENGYRGVSCPVAEDYYKKAITIPLYPKMTDRQVKYVVDSVIGAVNV